MQVLDEVYSALGDIVGPDYVSNEDFICHTYGRNVDAVLEDKWPDLVVRPGSPEEIQGVLKVANRYRMPIVQRGGGCDLTGGAKPIEDHSIVMDLTRLNRLLDMDEASLLVKVEAGITWGDLNAQLQELGYYTGNMGPGSGMGSTIGGGLSNHSSGGGGAFKYDVCTNHCLGLEVVLPNSEMITTGSGASRFVRRPFSRAVNGPDITGLFMGDSGLYGVKTKAWMRIFKKEEFARCVTYQISEPQSVQKATNIILEVQRRGGLGCWDLYFIPLGTAALLKLNVVEGWKNLPMKSAIIFSVSLAHSEEELKANGEQLEGIFKGQGAEPLGPEIEDGNWAKFHWEKQGHWQYFHYAWGGRGAGSMATASCHMIRTEDLPKWNDLFNQWYMKRYEWLAQAGGAMGSYTVFTLPNHIDFVHGFIFFNKPQYRQLNNQIRNDWVKTYLEAGGANYWLGESLSRMMIDVGAFNEPYYQFLKALKETLDPNRILSPGKFYL